MTCRPPPAAISSSASPTIFTKARVDVPAGDPVAQEVSLFARRTSIPSVSARFMQIEFSEEARL